MKSASLWGLLLLLLQTKVGSQDSVQLAPKIIAIVPSTNSINLSWTTSLEYTDKYYTISYTYAVINCYELPGGRGNDSVSGINGSTSFYSITDLKENTNYNISITVVDRNGQSITSPEITTKTLVAAPSVAPELRVSSVTPTNITLSWDEVPCLARNGMIRRYSISYCLDSICVPYTIVSNKTDRMITIADLIPREAYRFSIRAESEDDFHNPYVGPLSQPLIVHTSTPEALGFYLKGRLYPGNVSISLDDIGSDGDALMCLTNLVECCRSSDTTGPRSLGNLQFPNGSFVLSRGMDTTIFRTRARSSLLLHREGSVLSSNGIYTCDVPDSNYTKMALYVYLYTGNIPALSSTIVYSQSSSSVACVSSGGIINSVNWIINGVYITRGDARFSQTLSLVSKMTATFQAILSSNMINLIGTVICEVTDGNGRTSSAVTIVNVTAIEPAISGAIVGYPIDNDFYVGLQLNLTCFIALSYTRHSQTQTVDVEAKWSRSGIAVSTNNVRTVVELFSMGNMQYQTSILFNSLDTTDEGNYVCSVKATFTNERNERLTRRNEIFYTVRIKTIFFQLQLTEVSNCETWKDDNAQSKVMDIEKFIIKFMNDRCECEFTADRLTDRVFICDSAHPHSVIYQAQLHGTSQANVSRLAAVFLEWSYSDYRFIPVQLSLLKIERFCMVSFHTQSLCGMSSPSTHGVTVVHLGAGIGAAAVLIIFIIIFIVIIACCVMQKKRKLHLDGSNDRNISRATADYLEATDCHEDMGEYHSSCNDQCDLNIKTTKFSGNQVFENFACSAYTSP